MSIPWTSLVFPSHKICWISPDRRQGLFWELPGGQTKTVINNDPQDSLSNNSGDERHPNLSGAQYYCVIISAILFHEQFKDHLKTASKTTRMNQYYQLTPVSG